MKLPGQKIVATISFIPASSLTLKRWPDGCSANLLFWLAQILTELLQSGFKVRTIAILQKVQIAFVRADDIARMLDRTKVLFSSGHDFTDLRNQSGAIGAVVAVKFLKPVQIAELPAVEHDIVAASHLLHAVDRKTGGLIKTDA